MTILVGMVGSDGIVLAADQRMTQNAEHENEFDDFEGIQKIVHLKSHKVVGARVGDYISKTVWDKIRVDLDERRFDFTAIANSLEELAASTLTDEGVDLPEPAMERSLLLVFYGEPPPEPQLWRLRITPPGVAAEHIRAMTIRGALGNRARFFDHYFKESLPIATLTFLAAHIVLTAGRVDPIMIQGLDVAQFTMAGFRLLRETEKAPLRERSERLDALIREKLWE